MPKSDALEQPVLLLERSERSDIGDGERDEQLSIVAQARVDTPVLDAEAATIGVVSDLRGGVLQDALAHVISDAARCIPATMLRIANPEGHVILIGKRREDDVAIDLVISDGGVVL